VLARSTLTDRRTQAHNRSRQATFFSSSACLFSSVAPGSSTKAATPVHNFFFFCLTTGLWRPFPSAFPHQRSGPRCFGHSALPVEHGRCPILSSRLHRLVFDASRGALYGVEQLVSQAPWRMSGTNTTIQDDNLTLITYSAGWIYNNSDSRYASSNRHATTKIGSSLTVRFEGNGIE
jgi:hypothetical protein